MGRQILVSIWFPLTWGQVVTLHTESIFKFYSLMRILIFTYFSMSVICAPWTSNNEDDYYIYLPTMQSLDANFVKSELFFLYLIFLKNLYKIQIKVNLCSLLTTGHGRKNCWLCINNYLINVWFLLWIIHSITLFIYFCITN